MIEKKKLVRIAMKLTEAIIGISERRTRRKR